MNFGGRKNVDIRPVSKETKEATHTLVAVAESLSFCSTIEVLSRPGPTPIIELVQTCIEEAHSLRASDVHFEPTEGEVRIRLRIDGVLQDKCSFPKMILPEVISRIKVLSGLRTDEHQAAQDGRFRMTTNAGTHVDVRISITPTYYGENAVLRLLADHSSQFTLASLGFSEADQRKITEAIAQPYGMILATGPTGSGKTTTLYTLIKMLNSKEVSIITIEDPIEYAVPGITQIQINTRSNLTFAQGLRSILRQDPNTIMVGEIRDAETAGIAVNTALTGHLLLSTLHTNDSATTLPRLLDMNIDAYLVASTVNVAIGQRLVRKICEKCRAPRPLTEAEQQNLLRSLPTRLKKDDVVIPTKFYEGKGCDACEQTGFSGRIGIYEVLVVSPSIREAILRRDSSALIKQRAIDEGMTTMFEDGLKKAQEGKTTLSEILRTITE
jgi:type II secretory ATPase GspE/PulE/Tfp pilus assembly ATPase PilB-like protein